MKKRVLVVLLLTCISVFCWAKEEDACPPPCHDLSSYIFNSRFCCKRNSDGWNISCLTYATNLLNLATDQINHSCSPNQDVRISYSDPKQDSLLKEASDWVKQQRSKYKKKKFLYWVHQCPNQNIAMGMIYFLEMGSVFRVWLLHTDSTTDLQLESKVPVDLPADSPLITESKNALKTYLCYSFDPKKFLDTLEAPPFSFPEAKVPSSTDGSSAHKEQNTNASGKKGEQRSAEKNFTTSKEGLAPSSLETSAALNANAALLHSTNSFRLANIVFYQTFSPVPEVRHFESSDKTVDLKVNFKTGDKSSFQQKLRKTFARAQSRETECPNQNILLEFVVGNSYRAFLLHPSAIVSWGEPLYANALLNLPSENQKRQELCALNPTQFWK